MIQLKDSPHAYKQAGFERNPPDVLSIAQQGHHHLARAEECGHSENEVHRDALLIIENTSSLISLDRQQFRTLTSRCEISSGSPTVNRALCSLYTVTNTARVFSPWLEGLVTTLTASRERRNNQGGVPFFGGRNAQ